MAPKEFDPDYIFVSDLPTEDLLRYPGKYTDIIITHIRAAFAGDDSFDGLIYPLFQPEERVITLIDPSDLPDFELDDEEIEALMALMQQKQEQESLEEGVSKKKPSLNVLFGLPLEISEVVLYLPSDQLVRILEEFQTQIRQRGLDQQYLNRQVEVKTPLMEMIKHLAENFDFSLAQIDKMGRHTVMEILFEIISETTIAALTKTGNRQQAAEVALELYTEFAKKLPEKAIACVQYLTESPASSYTEGEGFVKDFLRSLDSGIVQRIKAGAPSTTRDQLTMIENFR